MSTDVYVEDTIAYIAGRRWGDNETPTGLYVLNVADPTNPEVLGYHHGSGRPQRIAVKRPYVFTAEKRYMGIYDCSEILAIPEPEEIPTPVYYFLLSSFPNPFNSRTTVNFSLPEDGLVKLSVFDLLGREIRILQNEKILSAGDYTCSFNADDLATGRYFLTINADGVLQTIPISLVK